MVARLRTQGERGQDRRYEAVGDVAELGAGGRVILGGDAVPGTGADYLCLSATHSYTSDSYGSGAAEGDGYANSGRYTLMPAMAPMLPERKTPRADVKGPQTAVVVGEGEIDCDEYGRILVRFHWDLAAANSMRCRVSQNWAGNGWGGMVIPRIGMEVVVEFLDGDPDQPLVTGCVYNGRNKVPYELPKHKTRSTFMTNTHKGKGFNELRFEDESGREEVFLHAERDLSYHIKNNRVSIILGAGLDFIRKGVQTFIQDNQETSIAGSSTENIGYRDGDMQLLDVHHPTEFGKHHRRLDRRNGLSTTGGSKMVRVKGTYIISVEAQYRVATQSSMLLNAKNQVSVGAQTIRIRSGDDAIVEAKSRVSLLSDGDVVIGNGKARIVLKKSGDIELCSPGTITAKASRIDLN